MDYRKNGTNNKRQLEVSDSSSKRRSPIHRVEYSPTTEAQNHSSDDPTQQFLEKIKENYKLSGLNAGFNESSSNGDTQSGDKTQQEILSQKDVLAAQQWETLENSQNFSDLWRQVETDAQHFRTYHYKHQEEKNFNGYDKLIGELSKSYQKFNDFVTWYSNSLENLYEMTGSKVGAIKTIQY